MPATKTYADLQRYIRRTAAADGASTFDDDKIRSSMADGFQLLESVRAWSFLRRTLRIATATPYKSGDDSSTVDYTVGSTSITGNSTTFQNAPGNDLSSGGVKEGDIIAVSGEQTWYEIAADAASDTALTLRSAYQGAATASGQSFIIARPWIALPNDFLSVRELVALGDAPTPRYVDPEEYLNLLNNYAGVSQPYCWTHMQKNDDDGEYLMLYPPPGDTVYQYDLRYNRRIGFLDISSANAWFDPITTEPAAGDIVLWDDREMAVLRAAIIYAGYEEFDPSKAPMAKARYETALKAALSRDKRNREPMYLGGGTPDRPYWY